MTKWAGRPHWEFLARMLGRDAFGTWLGIPAGTHFARPGATYTNPVPQAVLVPRRGVLGPAAGGAGWVATFHDVHAPPLPGLAVPMDLYVDITAPPRFAGERLEACDLDLDVVRGVSGRVWIDDEDEFAERRVAWRYPETLAADVVRLCGDVHEAVRERRPPFDRVAADRWLAEIGRL